MKRLVSSVLHLRSNKEQRSVQLLVFGDSFCGESVLKQLRTVLCSPVYYSPLEYSPPPNPLQITKLL